MRLFGDHADHVKWYSEEAKCTVSGKKIMLSFFCSVLNNKNPKKVYFTKSIIGVDLHNGGLWAIL